MPAQEGLALVLTLLPVVPVPVPARDVVPFVPGLLAAGAAREVPELPWPIAGGTPAPAVPPAEGSVDVPESEPVGLGLGPLPPSEPAEELGKGEAWAPSLPLA